MMGVPTAIVLVDWLKVNDHIAVRLERNGFAELANSTNGGEA